MNMIKAIEALQAALPTAQFALRGTTEFEALNSKTYQSGLNGDITPACIIQTPSKEDFSVLLITIAPYIKAGEAAFTIVGAGRQPAPGCSNIENGITLNLALIKGIDIKENCVFVGSDENCGSVFQKLEEQGLACAGARSTKGGFAGLALSGRAILDVVNYEVVLASGAIVDANINENTDLWRALRGGVNYFGVITRFDMRTFKQGPLWGGSICCARSGFLNQVKALVHKLQNPEASPHTHLMVSLGFAAAFGLDPVILNQLYCTNGIERPHILEPFSKIGAASYPRSLLEASAKKGGNSLWLTPDDGAIISIALLAYWVNPSDDEKILSTFKTVLEKLDENATAHKTAVKFKFLNYSFNFQDPIGSYGAENKARLQEASKKYDPEGIFRKGVPEGWKLFS
ncbi:FAD-binding domain-containing protein [Xylariaceae sp. FL1651]|nr:FAD-binding domain-containing protein [Xylariaceae sp. FL1651]